MDTGKSELSAKKTFLLLLVSWFVINLIQAIFTGILSDEAYYSLWGKHLAWGYFDHPPMVALFCFLSSRLFEGSLGVRFITVLTQIGTLLLIWHTIDDKDADRNRIYLFFILAASSVMFTVLGFVTTPDAPLLFFTALFLFSYKRFLRKENFLNCLLLCLSMSGMVYSKYQSCLVIGLIVLSNFRLLLKPRFWVAGICALLLLIPHFYWQYSNDFPSFQYHLVDRSNQFKIRYFLEYLPNQCAVFNPFILGLVIFVMIKYRSKDVFEKGLYFLIAGFIAFFWIMAYRGHVEPHWTVACSIAIIIVLYNKAKENCKIRKFVNSYIFGSLILILLLRIVVLFPSLGAEFGFKLKDKYVAIESVTGDSPVVFSGSFQTPSLYTYFTGKPSTTVSSVYNRRSQFDIWQFERGFEGKPVFICHKIEGLSKNYSIGKQTFDGFHTQDFHSAARLKVSISEPIANALKRGDTIRSHFTIFNPYSYSVDFKNKTFPLNLCACFVNKKNKAVCPVVSDVDISSMKPNEYISGNLYSIVPDIAVDEYSYSININNVFGPSLEKGLENKNYYRIKIVE